MADVMNIVRVAGAALIAALLLAKPALALDSIDLSVTAHPGAQPHEASVEEDEETFFSRGSHRGVRGRMQQPVAISKVDVIATCRAVLAEGPANYHKSFYDGCLAAVRPTPVRRVGRRVSSIVELDA